MKREEQLQKYATLLVKVGMNVQEDQKVFVRASVDASPFIRIVVEEAYKAGASDVRVQYTDDVLTQLNFKYRDLSTFETHPQYLVDERMTYARDNAAQLVVVSVSPENLKDADPKKVSANMQSYGKAYNEYMKMMQTDQFSWTVSAYPSYEWAQLVFPELDKETAFNRLLEAILEAVRVNHEDPVVAWQKHNDDLHQKADYLNKKAYRFLKYQGEGTDLTIGLPKGHIWCGASSVNADGVSFMANMPTEEVFTVPHKYEVDGYVSSTKPLSYASNIIDDFKLTFEKGKVVDYEARVGYDTLKALLETDENAVYLGEVALVPHDSPISNSNILYYNTLFDENASCHLALGAAYPFCLEGGKALDEAGLESVGLNSSITHEDFMIGGPTLNIVGITEDGQEEAIFTNGNWAF